MSAIRATGMTPEVVVRKMVHRMGYRYRLHQRDLPGRPDLVFASRRKVIFVHGCFWHQHDLRTCKIVRLPKSNTSYWIPKLKKNAERDSQHYRSLKERGWAVLVIWECETADTESTEARLRRFLGDKQQNGRRHPSRRSTEGSHEASLSSASAISCNPLVSGDSTVRFGPSRCC